MTLYDHSSDLNSGINGVLVGVSLSQSSLEHQVCSRRELSPEVGTSPKETPLYAGECLHTQNYYSKLRSGGL